MDKVAIVRSRTTINTIGDAFFVSREEEERKEEGKSEEEFHDSKGISCQSIDLPEM